MQGTKQHIGGTNATSRVKSHHKHVGDQNLPPASRYMIGRISLYVARAPTPTIAQQEGSPATTAFISAEARCPNADSLPARASHFNEIQAGSLSTMARWAANISLHRSFATITCNA